MCYDYYLHKSCGTIDDLLGEIGKPVKVSAVRYYCRTFLGFKGTKVPVGSSLHTVLTQALINDRTSLKSYKAEKVFKHLDIEVKT